MNGPHKNRVGFNPTIEIRVRQRLTVGPNAHADKVARRSSAAPLRDGGNLG